MILLVELWPHRAHGMCWGGWSAASTHFSDVVCANKGLCRTALWNGAGVFRYLATSTQNGTCTDGSSQYTAQVCGEVKGVLTRR